MKKKYLIIGIILIALFFILLMTFSNKDKEGFYTLKDDNIKSITSIVGNRKLTRKNKSKSGDTIVKTYKYESVKDPYTDLSTYVSYLQEKANFIPTKSFNLNDKNGEIQIARYSTTKEYIIIIDIEYSKNSYTIKITRGKGQIGILNNS